VDGQLRLVPTSRDDDHLKECPTAAGAEVEAKIVIQLFDHHRVADGVLDVLDRDAVLERRSA